MSYRTQWNLYGRDASAKPLPRETTDRICKALEEEADEWHGDYDSDELICAFMTDYSSGYRTVTELLCEHAQAFPDAVFMLDCHNTDEDWYQHILFHGKDKEELDGYIAYEAPRNIHYEVPAPLPRFVVVLNGGSVQGVFTNGGENADVVIVDRDESKLEGCDEDERRETREWIRKQLEQCMGMKALYGGMDREPRN